MKRAVWVVAASVAVLALTQTVSLEAGKSTGTSNEDFYKQLELFEHALAIVRSDYVEEPPAEQLIYGAIKGMLGTLDPHSQFLDPDSYTELKVDTEGEFGGLGIEITIKDGLLTIISPIDDTPAYKAGLQPKDRIVKIDGELTRGITLVEAVKKLRGKPNSEVKLTILRESEGELKDYMLKRDVIKIESVRDYRILDANIGYLRLSDFRENTPKAMTNAIEKLKSQGMDALIFDLRNNPGGLLDVSRSVAEMFLERNQLVVSTKGRLHNQNMELRARNTGPANTIPLVVMVNEGSASASEIVAGAIQDHHRGIILGVRSHGKASVQTIFPLQDGSALRLTTSKYYTPAGRMIHGHGIDPDVEVPFVAPPKEDEKDKHAEEVFDQLREPPPAPDKNAKDEKKDEGKKAIEVNEEEKKLDPEVAKKLHDDNQLARAVDLLKGIKVYSSRPPAGSS